MSTGGNALRLASLTRDLMERWRQTRDSWRDAKSREFEERFLRELELGIQTAATEIEQLETVIRNVRRDCE